jgi:hypothetical protein
MAPIRSGYSSHGSDDDDVFFDFAAYGNDGQGGNGGDENAAEHDTENEEMNDEMLQHRPEVIDPGDLEDEGHDAHDEDEDELGGPDDDWLVQHLRSINQNHVAATAAAASAATEGDEQDHTHSYPAGPLREFAQGNPLLTTDEEERCNDGGPENDDQEDDSSSEEEPLMLQIQRAKGSSASMEPTKTSAISPDSVIPIKKEEDIGDTENTTEGHSVEQLKEEDEKEEDTRALKIDWRQDNVSSRPPPYLFPICSRLTRPQVRWAYL